MVERSESKLKRGGGNVLSESDRDRVHAQDSKNDDIFS